MRSIILREAFRAVETVLSTPKLLWHSDPQAYYRYLGDDVIEGLNTNFARADKPLWLNLGYWRDAIRYPDAAQAMALKVGDAAGLGAEDAVLDVGFGFGDQDMFWAKRYRPGRIVGLNTSPEQVERARTRVQLCGLQDVIDFQVGSATDLPFEDGAFDCVTALESAHHFDTRQRFFEEAFRVLRPGGRLATADGASDGQPLTWINRVALRRWCVPPGNVYSKDSYCQRLRDIGFVDVRCESIRNHVFPGCIRYMTLRNQGVSMEDAIVELSDADVEECRGLELFRVTGITDYIIVSACKPVRDRDAHLGLDRSRRSRPSRPVAADWPSTMAAHGRDGANRDDF